MTFTVELSEDKRYIKVVVNGAIDRKTGAEMVSHMHTLGREIGIDKFLLDLTESLNKDSVFDQYQFAYVDAPAADGFNRFAKVAVLIDPNDHSHDFIETTMRNNGFNIRLFHTQELAMAFLELGEQQAG
ncbi:MAG: hypothetical protein P8Z77_10575 [Candidatus Thiodiazotropha sp.]